MIENKKKYKRNLWYLIRFSIFVFYFSNRLIPIVSEWMYPDGTKFKRLL